MMPLAGMQLQILCELGDEELKMFKWFLRQAETSDHLPAIQKSRLEKADRLDTLELIQQLYHTRSGEVIQSLLEKINRNDLVQRLTNIRPRPRHLQTPEPDPSEPPMSSYQRTLQSHLQNRFMCAQEGGSTRIDKKPLHGIYTELHVTNACDVGITKQHEVNHLECAPREPEEPLQPSDIFKHPSGKNTPVRTVLTSGIGGVGKTFLVQKFILDWAEGRANQDVQLMFPLTFRQLNLLKGRNFCLAELIHECIRESRDIGVEALTCIFHRLQTSGNTNFSKSPFKLLFVLDGLDESHLHLDFDTRTPRIDATQSAGVEVLLASLIKGELLPSARLWITTRPAAANQIPLDFVDIMTEVRGFTDPQKEDYFWRRFPNRQLFSKIMSHIRASPSLHIMCRIPVFCWITSTVLEDTLRTSTRDLPKTLTTLYTEFLVFHIRQMTEKYGTKKTRHIRSLAKLAFQQQEKGKIIFHEKDLAESGIDFREASVCSGVFTQVFQMERGWKGDAGEESTFSFVHLSIQEFLAAVHVVQSLIDGRRNVMARQQSKVRRLPMIFGKPSLAKIQRTAIDKALHSPTGHLDLFLRFLLGLSQEKNLNNLRGLLLKQTLRTSDANQKTVQYIKEKIQENPSAERCINLCHCLNELNNGSLVEEIQHYHLGSSGRR